MGKWVVGYEKNPNLIQIQIKSTYLSDKMYLKKSYVMRSLQQGPCLRWTQNISIWVHFVTMVSLIYFNIREIRNFLIPVIIKTYFKRKIDVVNQNFGCILGNCLWTNFHILDLDSYNLLLIILDSRFAKF
jgi:hypothetical protein